MTEDFLASRIFGVMTDIVLVLGRDGQYLKIPTTGANRLYAPPQELLGRTVRDVLPPKEAQEVCGVIQAALAAPEQESVTYEYSLPFPDRLVRFAATVTRLDEESVVWVARDITSEREAVDAVRERERRYRLLFERNPTPMWVFRDIVTGSSTLLDKPFKPTSWRAPFVMRWMRPSSRSRLMG